MLAFIHSMKYNMDTADFYECHFISKYEKFLYISQNNIHVHVYTAIYKLISINLINQ